MTSKIALVLGLILLNGFFVLAEMAVITARRSRLRQAAATSRRAATALELAERPEHFLSSVQFWITLLSILTGFLGGESIADEVQEWLGPNAALGHYIKPLSIVASVGSITLLQVILGELVPKRIAIVHAEKIAIAVAVPMKLLTVSAKPFVMFLSGCTNVLLKLTGLTTDRKDEVSEEEIRHLVAEGAEQGVIDRQEHNMLNRVLALGDRTAASLMTPRTRITWLDAATSVEENLALMRTTPHSRYPVCRGSDKDVLGIFDLKHVVANFQPGALPELFNHLAPAVYVPETARAAHLLETLRDEEATMALVVDEYGDIVGMVTLNDLMLAIYGKLGSATGELTSSAVVQRADGSWLVDGALGVDDLRQLLGIDKLPLETEQEFHTAAGLMFARFGRIPEVGEAFEAAGFRFEVIDLDGARIDKLLVAPLAPAAAEQDA